MRHLLNNKNVLFFSRSYLLKCFSFLFLFCEAIEFFHNFFFFSFHNELLRLFFFFYIRFNNYFLIVRTFNWELRSFVSIFVNLLGPFGLCLFSWIVSLLLFRFVFFFHFLFFSHIKRFRSELIWDLRWLYLLPFQFIVFYYEYVLRNSRL